MKQQTKILSRSASIAEALVRLHILDDNDNNNNNNNNKVVVRSSLNVTTDTKEQSNPSTTTTATTGSIVVEDNNPHGITTITIDVVGCDSVECESNETIQIYFSPFVRWIKDYYNNQENNSTKENPRNEIIIQLNLIGPNVPQYQHEQTFNLLGEMSLKEKECQKESSIVINAQVTCYHDVYDSYILQKHQQQTSSNPTPNLAIAFNAGVWGYKEWETTFRKLTQNAQVDQRTRIPFVITAYTLQEAEDDYDVIDNIVRSTYSIIQESTDNSTKDDSGLLSLYQLWGPEYNPFASKIDRTTQTSIAGRTYRENSAWQAWLI
jgi:hypothetical protein